MERGETLYARAPDGAFLGLPNRWKRPAPTGVHAALGDPRGGNLERPRLRAFHAAARFICRGPAVRQTRRRALRSAFARRPSNTRILDGGRRGGHGRGWLARCSSTRRRRCGADVDPLRGDTSGANDGAHLVQHRGPATARRGLPGRVARARGNDLPRSAGVGLGIVGDPRRHGPERLARSRGAQMASALPTADRQPRHNGGYGAHAVECRHPLGATDDQCSDIDPATVGKPVLPRRARALPCRADCRLPLRRAAGS